MQHQLDPQQWVNAHADYLYAFAVTRVNDKELAKELLQDTFLAGLENKDSFEGKASERTWLTAILKNKIVDVYRKRSRAQTVSLDQPEQNVDDFFDAADGHWIKEHGPREFGIENNDHLVKKEFEQVLEKCLQRLPPLWKTVFTMRLIEDEPANTICGELNVTASNFWVVIHRAKLSLRACLQKSWI
jgi:RNA polymerase sigma-70 factor (TIGR02943 family)